MMAHKRPAQVHVQPRNHLALHPHAVLGCDLPSGEGGIGLCEGRLGRLDVGLELGRFRL